MLGFVGLAVLVPIARAALVAHSRGLDLFTAERFLCPLTGVAAWVVWRRIDVGLARKRAALRCWGWLLMLSALWTAALQGLGSPVFGFGLLLLCLAVSLRTTLLFRPIRPVAAVLLVPYAVWLGLMTAIAILHFSTRSAL